MEDAAVEATLGPCPRCGTFMRAADSQVVEGTRFCQACAVRPDVDWLEGYRQSLWGKRDGWAWLFGITAPLQVLLGLSMLFDKANVMPLGAFSIASGLSAGLWWLGQRAARLAMPLVLLGQAAVTAVIGGPAMLLIYVLPFAILVSVVTSTRTRLFFKSEVTRDQLKQMWDVYSNNTVARYALQLGIVGLLFWPFAPLALLCGAIGLSRVDPDGRPPVGRKGSAITGIVCGLLGTIALGVFVVVTLRAGG